MSLTGKRILIVEDDWFLAKDLEATIALAGGVVVEPFPGVEEGTAALTRSLDAAILDVEVRDGLIYPLAAFLCELCIPVVFTTAIDRDAEPPEWHLCLWLTKPCLPEAVVDALELATSAR